MLGTRRGLLLARALSSAPSPSLPSLRLPSPSSSFSSSVLALSRPPSASRPPRRPFSSSSSASSTSSPDGPLRAYEAELAAGRLRADVYQAAAAAALQRFHERIHADDVAGAGSGGGGGTAGACEQGGGGADEESSWTGFLERWFSGGGAGGGANGRREREGYGIYLYGTGRADAEPCFGAWRGVAAPAPLPVTHVFNALPLSHALNRALPLTHVFNHALPLCVRRPALD